MRAIALIWARWDFPVRPLTGASSLANARDSAALTGLRPSRCSGLRNHHTYFTRYFMIFWARWDLNPSLRVPLSPFSFCEKEKWLHPQKKNSPGEAWTSRPEGTGFLSFWDETLFLSSQERKRVLRSPAGYPSYPTSPFVY